MSKKSILQKILAILARATIRKHQPMIVGITGSVGKTSTRLAVYAVLKKKFRVRTAEKNYNNEIGLPLTILGISHHGRNIFAWGAAITTTAFRIYGLAKTIEYPEVLVLEYGVDRPGDMDCLISLARPEIAVVTAIGDIPVHVEFFKDPEDLIVEKAKLIAALPHAGYAILNHDDYAVYDMRDKTRAYTITFGREDHAEVRMDNYEIRIGKDAVIGDIPVGISCKISYGGSTVPVRLNDTFGMPQAYAAAAASAVGVALKMNLVDISEALHGYTPPSGRMRLLKGVKHSLILDDTYNASPESMRAGLETLQTLPGLRKIAVLGDMLELGKYTEGAHRALGDTVAKFADMLFCIGARAKFIADEAIVRGLDRGKVFCFEDSIIAGRALDPMIREGDLIFVKGSQGIRMERVVEEIMADPERAGGLLVRQEDYWKNL